MRIITVATKYPEYLRQFYSKRPELMRQSYSEQHCALMAHSFGAAENRAVAFANLGYQTEHVFANAEPLQKRWAKEQCIAYSSENWMLDIVAAQICAFRPEILFFSNYTSFDANFIRHIRTECPSIRLVLGWCGAPYKSTDVFKEYDLLFSNIPELVEDFCNKGLPAYHLHHGFDPRILTYLKPTKVPSTDFAFIGSISSGEGFHSSRQQLLVYLLAHTSLEIWSEVSQLPWNKKLRGWTLQRFHDIARTLDERGWSKFLKAIPAFQQALEWHDKPQSQRYTRMRLARRAHPPLFGLDMFQQLCNTKIALNTHIDISTRSASNMRLFEVTGVGACLLTDWREDLGKLFEPEREVVTYRSAQECAEKVHYLLHHEETRQAIASAGQKRTLQDHTVEQRVAQLDAIIQQKLKARHGSR